LHTGSVYQPLGKKKNSHSHPFPPPLSPPGRKEQGLESPVQKDQVPFDLPDEYDFFQEFDIEQIIIEKQLSEEKVQKLKLALSTLSKRQHEVIYLKFYQHLDHGQIAEQMDISRQSVYNLLHESLQKLRSVWATPSSLPERT